jgi:RNA-binding protein 25
VNWRRTRDPLSNKPLSFAYCDFETADGVLRALRLLKGYRLLNSDLVVRFLRSRIA